MDENERIPTNLRTLLILEVLGQSDQPMTATEINAQIGLPKQTVHRLCATLEENGYLTRPGNGKQYQVARRLRNLGVGLLHNSRDHIARHQILSEVSQTVGETVNYAVPGAAGMNYLDRVETDWPFRVQLPVGTSVPFHCTASGKVFLSSLSPAKMRAMVSALQLDYKTQHTLTDPDALIAELQQIQKQGYALDQEEFITGMVAISVPVLDGQGRYIASLAYHGPLPRMSLADAIARKSYLSDAADRLSATLTGGA